MLGALIQRIRKEKGITKTDVANAIKVNLGHMTHIEKGERNPSTRTLKKICEFLEIPYQVMDYTLNKTMNEDQEAYECIKHIPYDRVLAVDADDFIKCPASIPTAHIAVKVKDDSMEPTFTKDSYVFLEFSSPLDYKDVGLFSYNGEILLRRFVIRKDKIGMRADKKDIEDIWFKDTDDFTIIGKVVGSVK